MRGPPTPTAKEKRPPEARSEKEFEKVFREGAGLERESLYSFFAESMSEILWI